MTIPEAEAFSRAQASGAFDGMKPPKVETVDARIALPWPPSTNALYLNVRGKGRVATKEYASWKREAGWTLQAQHPPKFVGPVEITIELCPPHQRRFDLDNKAKATLDLLTTHQVIRDDSTHWVRAVNIRRVTDGAPCVVSIRKVA